MPAFLEKFTEHIYSAYGNSIGDLCIVLPNRRAILYIRHYLSKMLDKTSFLPDFFAIEDFVAHCSGLIISDPLRDHFSLYGIHREIEGKNARPIERFFPYASWMLSDFNDIDMHLVDRHELFTYLSDVKAMSVWNPDGRPLSEFQKKYLEFFRSLEKYYDGLDAVHSKKGMAYQGKAYRRLASEIEDSSKNWTWDRIIFAGFNALTPSEEKIINYLLQSGQAEAFWDADSYYIDNPVQEAGAFLRKYFSSMKQQPPRWTEDNFSGEKKITITGIPQHAGQLKHAGEILKKLAEEKASLDSTALVLPDESLLLPMLNSIPAEAGEFNVTMGLSLSQSPLYKLLYAVLNMHRNAEMLSSFKTGGQRAYYSKDLLRLATHPWFGLLAEGTAGGTEALSGSIIGSKRVFFPADQLQQYFPDPWKKAIGYLAPGKGDTGSIMDSMARLLIDLREKHIRLRQEGKGEYVMELEYIFRFSALLERMHQLMREQQSIDSVRTLQMIFQQLSRQERIAFLGEPLQGLQVMGMLETRTLDFDRVIILSVNEGILPSAKLPSSFIPFELKEKFGLPTYRHHNKVFAYHFYRLLQRASEVHLIYNTEAEALGGSEKSRFITQLQHELPRYSNALDISEKILSIPPLQGRKDKAITVEKTPEVLDLLYEEAKKGFHPSSLSRYIQCPLQFYFARILKIDESEEIEETIDAKLLGTVIHETLRSLMEKHLNSYMNRDIFLAYRKEIRQELGHQFGKHFHRDEISFGRNYLIVNVARHMLDQIFVREASWMETTAELVLLALEEKLMSGIDNDQVPGGRVNLTGTVDRIDRKDGVVRILDYKTGNVVASKLKPENWEKLISDPEHSQAFQLMIYAWLYMKNKPGTEQIQSGIISLRAPGNGPYMFKSPGTGQLDGEALREFEQVLCALIADILDEGIPFSQTGDEKSCRYCTFREICNRLDQQEFK